jgi:hypothetical protein
VTERKPRAVFSRCLERHSHCSESCHARRYRYELWWPTGVDNDRVALGIFANPSTATAEELDPTLKRWRAYCRDWGVGWSVTANVRAWRETNPKLVPPDPEAIGPDNDRHLVALIELAEIIVCGYGKLGGGRGYEVTRLIRGLGRIPYALKLNKDGSPCHPLYLSSKLKPFPMEVTDG